MASAISTTRSALEGHHALAIRASGRLRLDDDRLSTALESPIPIALVLQVHTAATLAMFGLIWMVQIVHYPLMAFVGRAEFRAWHDRHLRLTTWVVGPLMLAETATALMLLEWTPDAKPPWLPWVGVALVLVTWISTAALQVPMHRRLERGWDERAHRFLVRSNWVRTCAWTGRGIVALAFAA